jgi:hypothetical protein
MSDDNHMARLYLSLYSPIERPSNIVKKAPFQWLDEATGEYHGRFVR